MRLFYLYLSFLVLFKQCTQAVRHEQTIYSKIQKSKQNIFNEDSQQASQHKTKQPLPVVLWHGMGDTAKNVESMGKIADYITGVLETQVYSIQIGATEEADKYAGYFGSVFDQVNQTCEWIKSVPELQNGYNGIGFSQGGQFLRALVETCSDGPQINNLITMGAQHQGIMEPPNCEENPTSKTSYWCGTVNRFIQVGAYWNWVQTHIVQAQYFKNPNQIESYLKYNTFLADINNERNQKNEDYKTNLKKVNKLVLVKFIDDNLIIPRETSQFGYFDGKNLQKMEETDLYLQDFIGLKEMNQQQKVDTLDSPGGHMQFTLDWFNDNIIQVYLQ